jgi:hypothetical protein
LSDSGLLVPAPRPVAMWISWWSGSGRFQWAHLDQRFSDSGGSGGCDPPAVHSVRRGKCLWHRRFPGGRFLAGCVTTARICGRGGDQGGRRWGKALPSRGNGGWSSSGRGGSRRGRACQDVVGLIITVEMKVDVLVHCGQLIAQRLLSNSILFSLIIVASSAM